MASLLPHKAAMRQAIDYYDAVINFDISRADKTHRSAITASRLMRSYARNVGLQASLTTIRDDASYSSNKGELQSGGTNSVANDGIYCINVNFTKGTFDIDEVTKMTVYCCWFGGDLNEGCKYIGNGQWEQTAYWGIDDTRYKFRMDVGGKSQFWVR